MEGSEIPINNSKNTLQTENTGYSLVQPSDTLLRETTEYLQKTQTRSSNKDGAFVPTGLGILITPDKRHFIFSMYGAGQGNVYDMPPLDKEVASIETSDVLFCGVVTASIDGYKLLTHAGGPEAVKDLTQRALNLAKANGAELHSPISMSVYCNPKQGHDSYVSGPKGYTSQIRELGKQVGVEVNVNQFAVNHETVIKI